jgi:hypothetical protein
MTDENTTETQPDEIDWDKAVVREGRQPGSVISVRLSTEETVQLRAHADWLGVTVSEVLRQALAAFEPRAKTDPTREAFVSAFTYGGSVLSLDEVGWTYSGLQQLWSAHGLAGSASGLPTTTEPARIVEKVTTDPLRRP